MKPVKDSVLAINGGSSSIKFAIYEAGPSLNCLVHGELESIGSKNTSLVFTGTIDGEQNKIPAEVADYSDAANFLIDWLEKKEDFASVKAIGHRVVFGMAHTRPEKISPELLEELKRITPYDPDHLPGEIKLVEVFSNRYPALMQIACFDTAFHTTMPRVAKLLPIPRRFDAIGIQRYGFHGLSYAFLMAELTKTAPPDVCRGKIILTHLGNGASLAAVKDGKSIDTSMGFTPTAGLPMGTRTGDLDPGVAWYLLEAAKLTPGKFNHLVNHESGLLGMSETSSDMRELMKLEATDNRAAEAIGLFCYQTKKWIGSFTAALGGLDTLVFAGGIGEHAPEIRDRICTGLEFLGMEIDAQKNLNNERIISSPGSRVCVRVIQTDEELMIAKSVCLFLNPSIE